MKITAAQLEKALAGVDGLVDVVKPFLPALSREGPELLETFVQYLKNADWRALDACMYERMTPEERRQLEDETYAAALAAARAQFRRKELINEMSMKLAMRLLTLLLAG
jgi:hypothetical protein